MADLEVSPEVWRTHASHVDQVKDGLGKASSASQAAMAGLPFGLLCTPPVPAALRGRQDRVRPGPVLDVQADRNGRLDAAPGGLELRDDRRRCGEPGAAVLPLRMRRPLLLGPARVGAPTEDGQGREASPVSAGESQRRSQRRPKRRTWLSRTPW